MWGPSLREEGLPFIGTSPGTCEGQFLSLRMLMGLEGEMSSAMRVSTDKPIIQALLKSL